MKSTMTESQQSLDVSADERVTCQVVSDAIVLVSKIHKPTLRALAYARASRPSTLEGVTVSVDPGDTKEMSADWERRGISVPLKILDSPYREITRPIVEYVRGLRRASPRDLVTVYIPEYVVGHWWENLLITSQRCAQTRLRFTLGHGRSVPWQLLSSERIADEPVPNAPGAVRRGEPKPRSPRRWSLSSTGRRPLTRRTRLICRRAASRSQPLTSRSMSAAVLFD